MVFSKALGGQGQGWVGRGRRARQAEEPSPISLGGSVLRLWARLHPHLPAPGLPSRGVSTGQAPC